jgi:predicted MFS family arabinose efflux permease
MAVIALQALGVATVLPAVARDLGGLGAYGWAFTAVLLASVPGIVGGGLLADRGRAAPAMLGALAVFGAGCLAAALAPTWPAFLAARVAQGLGLGVLSALVYVAVGRGFRPVLHARVLALTSAAWVVPSLVGPAAAGLVTEAAGWRWVFASLVPVLPLVAVLALPGMRALPADRAPALRKWSDHFLSAPVRRGVGGRSLLAAGFLGAEAFVPLGLVELRGWSVAEAGLVVSAGSLSWAAGAFVQARLDRRDGGTGRLGRLRAGALVLGAGLALTAVGMAAAAPLVAVGWAVAGLGTGIAYPSVGALVLGAGAAATGAVSSALQLGETLAIALCTALGGAALGLTGVATAPLVAVLAACAAAGALAATVVRGAPDGLAAAGARAAPDGVAP